jgi:hypothetical protein
MRDTSTLGSELRFTKIIGIYGMYLRNGGQPAKNTGYGGPVGK